MPQANGVSLIKCNGTQELPANRAAPAANGMDGAPQVAPRTPEGSEEMDATHFMPIAPKPAQANTHAEQADDAQQNGHAQQNGDEQQDSDMQQDNDAQQNNAVQQAANEEPERFEPGTVVQFDLDEGNEEAKTSLNFRGIRPIFGGKDGGVRHCEYRTVSARFASLQLRM